MNARRRLGRALLPVALAAVAIAVAPSSASAAATAGRVAVDGEGTTHIGYTRSDGSRLLVQGRSRSADGVLSPAQYVSPFLHGSAYASVVAVAPGTALHVWNSVEQAGGVRVRLRRVASDGALGPVQTLSEYGAAGPARIAVDASGGATIAWLRSVGGKIVLEGRRRAPNGTLSAVQRFSSSSPSYSVNAFDLGVDSAGNAVAAWGLSAPTPIIQARRRTAGGTLSAIQNITTSTAPATNPRVGVTPSGTAVIAFRRLRDGLWQVQVRRRAANGDLGVTQDVTQPEPGAMLPQIAADPTGAMTIAWERFVGGLRVIRSVRRSAGGSYGQAVDVTPVDGEAADFRLGVDADGDAIFAWQQVFANQDAQIRARRRTAGGALSPISDLSPADGVAVDPAVAVEPGGDAYVAWTDAEGGQVRGRRRTAANELGVIETLSY